MQVKLLHESNGLRTFAVVFAAGDDPVEGLRHVAADRQITGAQLTGIGAFSAVVIGYFDVAAKDYQRITIAEQVEVLSLAGNIGTRDEEPALHAHVVVGRSDGTAFGGHLLEGRVRPTLEVLLVETPRHLRRRIDPATGLALIDLSA